MSEDSFISYLSSSFLVVYGRTAICIAVISSWATWKSPGVFNDSVEQNSSHNHFLESQWVLWADLAKEEAERMLFIFTGELVNIRGFGLFFFFIPSQFSWIISSWHLSSSVLSYLSWIRHLINITSETFGSSLAISPVFLNVSHCWDEHWVPDGRYISYIHLEFVIKTREYFSSERRCFLFVGLSFL